jgi:haloacetate dehalogenase
VFEGFAEERIDVGEAELYVRHGGDGPPLLLLHGHPRTHATWHRVAPLLASSHTVVCPDLRGYGRSSVPPDAPEHAQASKRAMAADMVALMRALGHERFAVAGHDRGSMVASRLPRDFPDVITHAAVLDGIPIVEHLSRITPEWALAWWHWWFFAQTEKPAERVINADPDAWYRATAEQMGEEAFADYRRAIHDPDTVHAMVEDYRAGLTIDRRHDEEDRERGVRIECPTLVLWSTRDDLGEIYGDPVAIWRAWAPKAAGGSIESGHHMAEDAPEALAAALREFLAGGVS